MKNNIKSTEDIPPKNKFIDRMPLKESLEYMISEQLKAVHSVKAELPKINTVVREIHNKLITNSKSRIVYAGAGTSGRIGVQDGAELTPTFGWPLSRIKYIIAGGKKSLTRSIENAEDDTIKAKVAVEKLNLNSKDILIALAASSNTPFTVEVAKSAKSLGCLVIGIGNNVDGKLQRNSSFSITLSTGGEALAGSTRLKAGTSQKICLNIISTMVMVKLGRVKDGQMNYLKPTNAKLRKRISGLNIN